MKQDWGRKSRGLPSRIPFWSLAALLTAVTCVPLIWGLRFANSWSPLERFYWNQYFRAAITSSMSNQVTTRYQLLDIVDRRGKRRLAMDSDLVPGAITVDGWVLPFSLAPEVQKWARGLALESATYKSADVYSQLRHTIYHDQTIMELGWPAIMGGFALFILFLFVAVPKDMERRRSRRYGRRLKGPELVTAAEFNRRNRSDGIGFHNKEPLSLVERILRRDGSSVRIPRDREATHLLIMGDSGTGKSSLIRQLLLEVEKREETAIIYDPAPEYTAQFYKPERGDVILNPLDQRMPYWSPSDELEHEAEALTVAASLFADHHKENPFFIEGPRKVFAHLLTLRPSPSELIEWLSNEQELDRRVKGTELAMLIYAGAAAQRAGILASLNMIADSLKLLPKEEETSACWSAAEWSKRRQGWIFLTSMPQFRQRLLPLTSLWLDLLVLRLMNRGATDRRARKTWFVLDELASLQKLPQLHTAVTENRKSNCPVVLGFQGRAQLESRYGHDAEAMLSQPATKIFLRTSEPKSAKWISQTIGEIEIERVRESRTREGFPRFHSSRGDMLERQVEPLIMPSEIQGLENLHGYLKSGNLAVRMRFPYIDLPWKREPVLTRLSNNQQKPLTRTLVGTKAATAGAIPTQKQLPFQAEATQSAATAEIPFFE